LTELEKTFARHHIKVVRQRPSDASAGRAANLRPERRNAVRRPDHLLHTVPQETWSNRSIAAVIGVGLIHLLFFYGLVSGLSMRIVQSLPNIIDVRILETAQPQAVELPPPPMPDLAQPRIDFVPPPEIRIAAPAAAQTITVEQKIANTSRTAAAPSTAPATSAALPAPTPARSIASTHTTPPYPPLSRRLGEEGIVQLKVSVGADGKVASAIIEKSSGSERLDAAAREWVASHWRYHPATRDGKAVASQTQVKVVFNLKTSR
jgi:protein TonB